MIPNPNGVTGEFRIRPNEVTRAEEREYTALIAAVVAVWRQTLVRVRDAYRNSPTLSALNTVLNSGNIQARGAVVGFNAGLAGLLERFLERHTRQFSAQITGVVGFDVRPFLANAQTREKLEVALAKSVALIQGLSDEIEKRVRDAVFGAFERGDSTSKLIKELRDRLKFVPARAKLIAVNELGNLNAALTEARHKEAGVTHFEWSTSQDERVREEHQRLHGKVFSYARPPSEGLPGQPIRCRCVAIAVLTLKPEPIGEFG